MKQEPVDIEVPLITVSSDEESNADIQTENASESITLSRPKQLGGRCYYFLQLFVDYIPLIMNII
jgi:hypothetical protein